MASMLHLFLLLGSLMVASADSFYRDFEITWGDGRAKILNNGQLLTLSLDKASGSGFQSKNEYLYGKIDMQLKLVPGNSAGTVTAYYPDSHITHVSWVGTMCHIPLVKTDWTRAPFTASYRNFKANACVWSKGKSSCASNSASSRSKSNAWFSQQLDSTSQNRLNWVKKNYMIYNYCTDTKRFPQGLPVECRTV